MIRIATPVDRLYKARAGVVDLVEVPEFGYAMVDGDGAPTGPPFAEAIQALYTVSYGAHFQARKEFGTAPRVMPLEALWWFDDLDQPPIVLAVAAGERTMELADPDLFHWRAMIMQPEPVDADMIRQVVEKARAKQPLPALDSLRYERWEEGPSAQTLHVGPYAAEGSTIAFLHSEIAARGCRPRGRHHEIYLGDPRRSAPERLRTLIRQPVEPA